jgi:three-Cys-motif partner protein
VPRKNFHAKDKPFDEGTLTKLDIFQLYTREWLPVFLARQPVIFPEIHIYDFFCGPGVDAVGTKGSPIRIIDELIRFKQYLTGGVKVRLHFYDSDADKIIALRNRAKPLLAGLPHVVEDIHTMPFDQAFAAALPTLNNPKAAKLVLLDPCGVNYVTKNVFGQVISSKVTDFMFFLPSSYLHRFHAVDSIPIKIDRPDDFYHVHRRTFDVFKGLKPAGLEYYMAPFSIKKEKGIYGIIFGSSKRLGMDKFLNTAWDMAPDNGEANFDIHREKTTEAQSPFLSLEGFTNTLPATKLGAFEDELEAALLAGRCPNESSVVDICFEHGVKRQHAEPVLKRLKENKAIQCAFRVPQLDTLREIVVMQPQVAQ